MATNTAKKLYRGAASLTTTTVLYTVPAATKTVVTNIVIVNTAATSATFTYAMGAAAGQVAMQTTSSISANSTIYIDLAQVIDATETITGGASAITVNYHISGMEIA